MVKPKIYKVKRHFEAGAGFSTAYGFPYTGKGLGLCSAIDVDYERGVVTGWGNPRTHFNNTLNPEIEPDQVMLEWGNMSLDGSYINSGSTYLSGMNFGLTGGSTVPIQLAQYTLVLDNPDGSSALFFSYAYGDGFSGNTDITVYVPVIKNTAGLTTGLGTPTLLSSLDHSDYGPFVEHATALSNGKWIYIQSAFAVPLTPPFIVTAKLMDGPNVDSILFEFDDSTSSTYRVLQTSSTEFMIYHFGGATDVTVWKYRLDGSLLSETVYPVNFATPAQPAGYLLGKLVCNQTGTLTLGTLEHGYPTPLADPTPIQVYAMSGQADQATMPGGMNHYEYELAFSASVGGLFGSYDLRPGPPYRYAPLTFGNFQRNVFTRPPKGGEIHIVSPLVLQSQTAEGAEGYISLQQFHGTFFGHPISTYGEIAAITHMGGWRWGSF